MALATELQGDRKARAEKMVERVGKKVIEDAQLREEVIAAKETARKDAKSVNSRQHSTSSENVAS